MSTNLTTTINSYDKTANEYHANTLNIDTSEQRNKFLSYLPEKAFILDVGCGSGRDAKVFSDNGNMVIGIDLSKKLLDIAKEYAPQVNFQHMNLLEMCFPNDSFDGIWAMSVLMHLEKKKLPVAIKKCAKVLEPNGILYFCLKRGTGEGLEKDSRYDGIEKYFSYYSDEEIPSLLKNTNLTLLSSDTTTIDKSYATKPWMNFYLRKNN
ncbi:MAG: class I SAM-dependent methyltransferase [Candidatus Woesearchaeota archaeon]|jgi:ubiquinone/menaquinone biosynthesis C-methylase UbiE